MKTENIPVTFRASVGILIYLVLSNLLCRAGLLILSYFPMPLIYGDRPLIATMIIEILASALALGAASLFVLRSLPKEKLFSFPKTGYIFFLTFLFFFLIFISSYFNLLFDYIFSSIGIGWSAPSLPQSMSTPVFIASLFRYILFPAVFEELFFRGALLRCLSPFGALGASLGVSVLFTVCHQNPVQWLSTFTLSLALCLAALTTESLIVPIILHIANNTLAFLQLWFSSTDNGYALNRLHEGISIFGVISLLVFFKLLINSGVPKFNNVDCEPKKELWLSPILIIIAFGLLNSAFAAHTL